MKCNTNLIFLEKFSTSIWQSKKKIQIHLRQMVQMSLIKLKFQNSRLTFNVEFVIPSQSVNLIALTSDSDVYCLFLEADCYAGCRRGVFLRFSGGVKALTIHLVFQIGNTTN